MSDQNKRKVIFIESMQGIGDQLYQYPFVDLLTQDEQNDVYIQTVLPDLYNNHYRTSSIKLVAPPTETYRTQQKHLQFSEFKFEYVEKPKEIDEYIKPFYSGSDLLNDSIISSMAKKFNLFDRLSEIQYGYLLGNPLIGISKNLEVNEIVKKAGDKRIAIVRPSTIRKEWVVLTRSPKPQYISWCAKVLRENGYFVISIADLSSGEEWLENDELPPADLYLHSGELGILGTLNLISKASIVVGGSGFIIPAAVSMRTPLFVIFGGRMAYDSPYKVFHKSMTGVPIGWAMPDKPCRCTFVKHECDKTVSRLDSDFYNFLLKLE